MWYSARLLADIAARFDVAERLEVELILAAADEGQHIPHRPDVSPDALLGILVNVKGRNSVAA